MHPWERAAAAIRNRPDLAQRSVPLPPEASAERDIREELADLRRRVEELEAEVEATTAGRIGRMNDDALEDAAADSMILDGVEFRRLPSWGRPSDVNDARWATRKMELHKGSAWDRTIGAMLADAAQKGP